MSVSPPPVKPPRTVKQTRETSGLLMTVIRTLSASETNEQRDREKAKLEKEYKKCDQRVDELVSVHDAEITQVMQIFGSICGVVGACRARVQGVRARLVGCKQLLRWRRNDLRRLCGESAQHRHTLLLLSQIEQLTGVGTEMSGHLQKGHYLNAATVLRAALVTAQTDLCRVEALQHLRTDLEVVLKSKRQSLYDRILRQINIALYQVHPEDFSLKRQGSSRRPELPRLISSQSEDGIFDISPQFEIDLNEDSKNLKIHLAILIEANAVINMMRQSTESIKIHMQTELLTVISKTSQYILDFGTAQLPLTQTSFGELLTVESEISKKSKLEAQSAQPLVELISLLLTQWRIIAERHEILLEILKYSNKKYNTPGISLYTMTHYWSRVQAVLQLLLTDYLDIQSLKSGSQRMVYPEQPTNVDINSYFVKKKTQSKKKCRLFKFSGSAVETVSTSVERGDEAAAAGYKLVCTPAPEHLTHIYHVLDDFMDEIESHMGGSECSLRVYLGELIRGAQGERAAAQLLDQINELCPEPGAWRELTVIPLTPTKNKTLFKCGVQSWEACAHALAGWIRLGDIGARAARSALAPALTALATAARRRATYLAPRARSYAWRTDKDITRFLKSLPNWLLLKNPPVKGKKDTQFLNDDIQRSYEREAEILGSSLVDGNVSEKEIITNIVTLRDIAIMCETMEWMFVKLSHWKSNAKLNILNDSKMNGVSSSPSLMGTKLKNSVSLDALLAELTNTAAVFEEISDNCLLLLHLEVRMQCFYYLGKLGSSLGLTSEPAPSASSTHIVPESPATSLARTLHAFSEHVAPVLHHRRRNYIMEGLGEMMSAVVVGSWRVGGSAAIGSAAAQLEPLRHCLTAAQISPDGLHKASLYLQMLTMTSDEILSMVAEKGAVFSELEYMNAFQVIAKSTNQSDSTLKANLNKLSNILGNVGVTV